MTNLKFSSVVFMGLLLSGCSESIPSRINYGLMAIKPTQQVSVDNDPKPNQTPNEEKLLRYLAEKSDLIVIGRVKESKLLVDPAKKQSDSEKAFREGQLPTSVGSAGGKIFEVAVIETLYLRSEISTSKIVQIYSIGDPFSLHTRVARLVPDEKYLLFLSRANEGDIVNELKIEKRDAYMEFEDVHADQVFLVTEDAPEAIHLLKNDRVIKMVKSIVKELGQ
jgi:hypothetical protein